MSDDEDDADVLIPRHDPDLVEIHPRDVRDLRPGDILRVPGPPVPFGSSPRDDRSRGRLRPAIVAAITTQVHTNAANKGSSFTSTISAKPASKSLFPQIVTMIPTCVLCGEELDDDHPKYCEICLDDVTQYAKDSSGL